MSAVAVHVADGVARILLDNGPINLFDREMIVPLSKAIKRLADDDDARVVIISSNNADYFIAHYDVTLLQREPDPNWSADQPIVEVDPHPFQLMCERLRTMPKPTIAVIEGRAGGGGSELALSCDMRFAAHGRAIFNQPEVALGILPGGSGTVRLPRLLGRSRALEVVLGCDDIDADLAERWGLVNRTLDPDDLWPFVERLASRLRSFPPAAVAAAKASVLRADVGVREHLGFEMALQEHRFNDPATRAAMDAFIALGGQTPAGESRLGELVAEIGIASSS